MAADLAPDLQERLDELEKELEVSRGSRRIPLADSCLATSRSHELACSLPAPEALSSTLKLDNLKRPCWLHLRGPEHMLTSVPDGRKVILRKRGM